MTKKSRQNCRKTASNSDKMDKTVDNLSVEENKRRVVLIDDLLKKCTYYNNNTLNNSQLLSEHKDISALVNDIIAIERGLTIQLPERSEQNWVTFKEWLTANKIDVSKVAIDWVDDSQGYGLKATQDINESELILDIPRKAMMSCETVMKSRELASFIREDPLLQHMPNIVLALHVIDEYCKPDSFWRPYLQCLPSSYQTALYLTDEDVNQLKGTQVFEEVIKMKRNIGRQYAYFSNQMRTNRTANKLSFKRWFTYELYRWAVSTIMTRQNSIPSSDGHSMISALIPLWDMCNHRHGKISTDFDVNSDSGLCLAMDRFTAGQQIFIYYGPRSNGEFFVHNGFVYKDNCNDFVPLRLGISKNDSLYQQKYELCKRLNINVSGVYRLYDKSKPMDSKLLAFLRVFHFERAELELWSESESVSEMFEPKCQRLMHLNDKIDRFLANRSVILLTGYPKTDTQCKYSNPLVEQLVKSEIDLLKSYNQ